MTKLTAAQKQQVQQKLAKIEQLRSEQHLLKNQIRPASIISSSEYDKQRRTAELEDFFSECLGACSRDLKRMH